MSDGTKVNPIIQYDESVKKINPMIKSTDRNEFQYVITKNDRQHVRGNKLCIDLKGIHVYTDIDNAVLVNTLSNEIYIYYPEELAPSEEREYLLLMVFNDEELDNTYQGIVGRQETFDYIVENAEILDFDKSMIMAETTKMKDMITIYEFMKMCIDHETVENPTGFDPDDYGSNYNEE